MNSPDLGNYDFKEWTDETRDKVKSVVENTVPSMRTNEAIRTEASRPQNISLSTPAPAAAPKVEMEDLNLDLNLDLDSDDDFNSELYSGL
jgi:hypothetical protein